MTAAAPRTARRAETAAGSVGDATGGREYSTLGIFVADDGAVKHLRRSAGRLLRVAAELAAHRGEHLVGELAEPPGLEPLIQRGGDDRGGHPLLDRGQH